jgi:hypothetical protein
MSGLSVLTVQAFKDLLYERDCSYVVADVEVVYAANPQQLLIAMHAVILLPDRPDDIADFLDHFRVRVRLYALWTLATSIVTSLELDLTAMRLRCLTSHGPTLVMNGPPDTTTSWLRSAFLTCPAFLLLCFGLLRP